jgi:hypothetical protein
MTPLCDPGATGSAVQLPKQLDRDTVQAVHVVPGLSVAEREEGRPLFEAAAVTRMKPRPQSRGTTAAAPFRR